MDFPSSKVSDPKYIEKKRAELKEFFKNAFPQEALDKIIENELKPLTEGFNNNRPYIAASASGPAKSEYDVMTGQPFTEFDNHDRPLTIEEIKEKVKDNPIIAEKAKQIQIVINSENKDIAIPIDQIQISKYTDMKAELASADGDIERVKAIKYKNNQILMTAVAEYKAKSKICKSLPIIEDSISDESSDDKEFDAIDKVVTEYTNKSYETRFQETKEMFQQLADKYEDPNFTENYDICPHKMKIEEYPILKDSSSCLIKQTEKPSVLEVTMESYSINEAINIPLKSNAIKFHLSGEIKNEDIEDYRTKNQNVRVDANISNNFEAKLKDTEKYLQDISTILNQNNTNINNEKFSNIQRNESKALPSEDSGKSNQKVKFDAKMEETLHSALENIYDIGKNENANNNELEFNEMKSLARNIVEGAENLSTLIREDITNKLNSMNELLNDVNEALENSRKSNTVYQNLKEEGEARKRPEIIKINNNDKSDIDRQYDEIDKNKDQTVSQLEIDDINSTINGLNNEIQCHESRLNTSKANYEIRNKECQDFIKQVDGILQKSHNILHPKSTDPKDKCNYNTCLPQRMEMTNNKLDEINDQEKERNMKIDNLLYDIKDKMKDNKEVLRLANNLLRREERKKLVATSKIVEIAEDDEKAKGDYVRDDELKKDITSNVSEVPLLEEIKDSKEDEQKKKENVEKERQKEFQIKIEKELEEMNRGPRMTKEFIKNNCKQHKLYVTPYLNDILYLHFKGFSKIENLEEYTGLKCIFLENNGIERIEGLDTLSELKCLYLHYNVIRKIENLNGCPKLDTLNLDHNFVTKIENLDVVPDLHTLSISHNMLKTVDDLDNLRHCKNLSVLDLSYNRLEDPLIVDVLSDMAVLKVLVLTGNPVVRNIPAYRKTLTLRLKELLNLDNRPIFPRDRACAVAWQRGGVQEEIDERRRWIAKDQEKVMESVRYLIKMRDENKAKREAREREEREKMGLPAIEDKEEEKEALEADRKPEELSKERKLKGVAEDMLSGSEAEDSTSDSDSSDDDSKFQEAETEKIEWSQVDRGKHLIQELKDEQITDEQWSGFGMGTNVGDSYRSSEIDTISNLLFNQSPHIENKRASQTFKESSEISKDEKEDNQSINTESFEKYDAKKKPLIEIIEEYTKKSKENKVIIEKVKEVKGIEEDGDLIIDRDRKLAYDKFKVQKVANKNTKRLKKPRKHIIIKEVSKVINKLGDNGDSNENNNDKKCGENSKQEGNESENHESIKPSNSTNITSESERRREIAKGDGEGDGDGKGEHDADKDLDLEPSAKDLEIFAELEKEQLEREARIARGEPAVDPMKLYDAKIMEEFHKTQEPAPAHALVEKNYVTSYSKQNGFDRIALSQLTAGETPDESKVKLTHVPGAALYQNVNKTSPISEVTYEIGEEKIESAPSSSDTESIHISDDSDPNSSESDLLESPKFKCKENKPRPSTSKGMFKNENLKRRDEDQNVDRNGNPNDSGSSNLDHNEAKQTIIDMINSYDDDRFPSQGTNYSNMAENDRINNSVATEILNKTIKYEEDEMYKQLDAVNTHASRVDNRTNSIIEQISDELENEYSITEVSHILETQVHEAEQRWRSAQFVRSAQAVSSPTKYIVDELDATLIPSEDASFEDTLTEDIEKNKTFSIDKDGGNENIEEANDSGICNESIDNVKVFKEKENDEEINETMENVKDVSADDEVFEDCVDDVEKIDNVENYTLEMKLALGIGD
ncbi:unnamed protein product, partial [Brenthis ino]